MKNKSVLIQEELVRSLEDVSRGMDRAMQAFLPTRWRMRYCIRFIISSREVSDATERLVISLDGFMNIVRVGKLHCSVVEGQRCVQRGHHGDIVVVAFLAISQTIIL